MPNGIDIYTKYQNVTDWHAVRSSGVEFAYVKVSDGDTNKDDGGWGPAGRAAGVAMGAYHYAQPGNPVAQADRLCNRAIQAGLADLAPALDLEDPFARTQFTVDFAVAFIRQVKARGFRPCLYANNTMMQTVRNPVKQAVPETIIWVARYGAQPTVQYDVWQHADNGRVPGISASGVDLDQGIIPRNTGAMEADLTPEEHNRQVFIEQGIRSLLNQITGNPKGDPIFDANMKPIPVADWGWPSMVDETKRFSLVDYIRLIDLHTCQDNDNSRAVLDAVKNVSANVSLSDPDLAKIATAIIGALPASLAQGIVDEISARLEGK